MHANNITPQRRENDNVGKRENWKDDDADGEAMESSTWHAGTALRQGPRPRSSPAGLGSQAKSNQGWELAKE